MDKELLKNLYCEQKLSVSQIATRLDCSQNRVNYWLNKYEIPKRTISEAVYQRNHPNGDPFHVQPVDTLEKAELFGMGMGLYWGEGTKAAKYAIRLGNSDPDLIYTFMRFLQELYSVEKDDFKFGLQLFTDCDVEEAFHYWTSKLGVKRSQFYKVHVTISGSIGTYRTKSRFGVVTLYYHNSRLRAILADNLQNLHNTVKNAGINNLPR